LQADSNIVFAWRRADLESFPWAFVCLRPAVVIGTGPHGNRCAIFADKVVSDNKHDAFLTVDEVCRVKSSSLFTYEPPGMFLDEAGSNCARDAPAETGR
jgi:hypothetical protein